MKKTTVLLIDDHAIVRMGLISLLKTSGAFDVVGDAGDGPDGIEKALRLRPDVVILDLLMPVMDGLETARRLLAAWPEAKILMLTTFGMADGLARALEAGSHGAILKSADWKEFRTAVAEVAANRRYVADDIAQMLAAASPLPSLSPRQRQILERIVEGRKTDDIAHELKITSAVVKEHLTILFHKLGVTNRAEAVAVALKKHLLRF